MNMMNGYVYFLIEEDSEEFKGCVKIGTAIDPLNRPNGYQAGNPRKLRIILTLIGGQLLEAEFHRKFAGDRVGLGGSEWYKVTPALLDFVREKLEQQLVVSTREINEIGELIDIPTVELGDIDERKLSSIVSINTIRSHSVVETHSPINPYAKACGRKMN